MSGAPLCFVLMPFGRKPNTDGSSVDFDAVYADLIRPAILEAGMEPLRADEELLGGVIHKPMYERLIMCEYAVADLTAANANVFYELGVRHGLRPWSTVLIAAEGGRLPFDIALDRVVPYALDDAGRPIAGGTAKAIAKLLDEARKGTPDSPVFQLVDGLPVPEIDRLKTDVFRDRAHYSNEVKRRLAEARRTGAEAVAAVGEDLEPVADAEAGVAVDLLLSYRAVGQWERMIDLVERMAPPLAASTLVREQLGFALNRAGRGEEAERVLTELIAERGASSETYGLLGRVHKDRWQAALERGSDDEARGHLEAAIAAYLSGFEADWRDAYPGVNVVTLMEVSDPPDPRRERLIPVVRYAVDRRIESGDPDYWDHATALELAVIAWDEAAARTALGRALAALREPWEAASTADNLAMLSRSRAARGESAEWADAAEAELRRRGPKNK